MSKIFDLRFVIGVFFSVVGLLLLLYGLLSTEKTGNVNEWCGGIFIIFGVFMIILSFQKNAADELMPEDDPNRKH